MYDRHQPLRCYSALRLLLVGVLLSATLAVSVASRGSVVRADSGEAPYGTTTQSLESAISLGTVNTCVITNGNLVCWGNNKNAVLGNGLSGDGTDLIQTAPSYVKDSVANSGQRLSNVIGVATADNHTCAIIAPLGKVKCWGLVQGWLLGRHVDSSVSWQPYPDFVKSAYIAGDQASFDASGDLVGATALASGTYGSCALLDDGKVKCWGQNGGHAGSGVGYVTACTTQPIGTAGCSVTNGTPIDNIKQITKTGDTTCGIKDDVAGTMLCWGADGGKFGIGTSGQTSVYPKTAGADTFRAVAVGNAQYSQCGLYQNTGTNVAEVGGTVKCWGQNNLGELGRNSVSSDPGGVAEVIGITNAIAIAGQERSYCALLIDTKVKCWGKNSYSMFVVAEPSQSAVRQPSYMLSNKTNNIPITGVAAISVGTEHVCVIMQSNGSVRCAGLNTFGQLGDGTVIAKGIGTGVDAGESCSSNCTDRSLTGAGGEFMPPVFLSVEVETSGTKIVLTYEKALKTAPLPLTSSFVVTVGGVTRSVASVAIVGSTVELTFASPIWRSLSVEITYNDPTTSNDAVAVQDDVGNDAATLTTIIVANNSTVANLAPTLLTKEVNGTGTKIILTYDEPLSSNLLPTTTPFTITVGGSVRTISSIALGTDTATLELTLSGAAITEGQAVTIAYAAPTVNDALGNGAIQDLEGKDAASFTTSAVTNTIDSVAPSFVSGAVNTGGSLVLTYSEALAEPAPATSSIVVTISGTQVTVVSVTIVGSTVVVVTSPVIGTGDVVTFRYTDPTAGNDVNAIQDAAGNDAASSTSTYTIPSGSNGSTQLPVTTTSTTLAHLTSSTSTTVPTGSTGSTTSTTSTTVPTGSTGSTTSTTVPTSVKASLVPTTKTVDGDAPDASTSTEETKSISGKNGKATFSDGSSFEISKDGNLIPKLFTAYVGTVTGSVKVTYKVGKKTVYTTCSYGTYGSTKPKKVTKSVNGFFPKAFISPKKKCLMPPAAIKALNTQLVTISAKLKFARLWPTTAKPKNPESGAAIRPVKRAYSVKIGTAPK